MKISALCAVITLALYSGNTIAQTIPEGFESFFEPKKGEVTVEFDGASIEVTALYHKGYFKIEKKEDLDNAIYLLGDSITDDAISNVIQSLKEGIIVRDECQYLDRVCKVGNNEIALQIDTISKKATIYLGKNYYGGKLTQDNIKVSSTDASFIANYDLFYNREDRSNYDAEDFYSSNIDSALSIGNTALVSSFYLTDSDSEVEDTYLLRDFDSRSALAGYASTSKLIPTVSKYSSIGHGSNSYYGFSVFKNQNLKKNRSKFGTVDVFLAG